MGLEMEGVPNQPSPIMGRNLRIQENWEGMLCALGFGNVLNFF